MNSTPVCSIIIVSYKNFEETTGPCLQSLRRCPEDIEIIIVDNSSGAATREQLTLAAEKDPRIQIHFLEDNRGYAAGNNIGAKAASSPLLLLLNSDTLVPRNAVRDLCSLMERNPQWDMLGPVTNSAGSDQEIFCPGSSPEEILLSGKHWCENSPGIHFQTDRLIFFCVVIRSRLYQNFHGLDEEFGLGYYEDTDFVYRAVKSGKQLLITEEVFVYHKGKGSFSKKSGAVRKLMKRNRKLFKRKHGHGETTDHWRIKNLQALERYHDCLQHGGATQQLQYAFSNRRQLAETLLPNSPVKRFFYRRKLNRAITLFNNSLNPR